MQLIAEIPLNGKTIYLCYSLKDVNSLYNQSGFL